MSAAFPSPALLARLGMTADASPAQRALYARYVRALALLSECAPYLEEPDYVDQIDVLLADAQAHYPLEVRKDGDRWAIAPRESGM